jgi:hypothetical protein
MIDAIELARMVGESARSHMDVQMSLVCGSMARGLADDASDVDLYLYGGGLDVRTIRRSRLLETAGASLVFGVAKPDGWFEKYRLDGGFVDVEYCDVRVVEDAVRELAEGRLPPHVARLAAGLRDAVPAIGERDLERHRRSLVYNDAVALTEVRTRSVRLLPVSVLYRSTWARDDAVSYASRVSPVMLDAVALVAAANRAFVPVDEPKWLPWHLARLERQPEQLADVLADAFGAPSRDVARRIDAVLREVLDLVDDAVPGADTRVARFALDLATRT